MDLLCNPCKTTLSGCECYSLTVVFPQYSKVLHFQINPCHIEAAAVNVNCSVLVLLSFPVSFIQ